MLVQQNWIINMEMVQLNWTINTENAGATEVDH
jgi:hypothetical protein